jgi:cold shock CspA family protein
MRTIVILAAGALLLAAAIVEIPSRLWPDSHLALLLVAFIALFAQGWLGSRLLSGQTQQAKRNNRKPAANKQKKTSKSEPRQPRKEDKARPAREPQAVSGPRESGTVKWFNRSKGFGFIVRESGDEIFVHQRSIRSDGEGGEQRRPSLRDGQAVSFVVVERDKGNQAEDVTPES